MKGCEMTKEAMQQALELIERLNKHGWILADFETEVYAALDSLKAALEQPVQEPVAWLYPEGFEALQAGKCWTAYPTQHEDCNTPLYIAMPPMPVQRPWVGLTEQDMPSGEDPIKENT
jgi:hypothetical protein